MSIYSASFIHVLVSLLLVCTPRSLGRLFTITQGRWRRGSTGNIGPVGPPGVLVAGLACFSRFRDSVLVRHVSMRLFDALIPISDHFRCPFCAPNTKEWAYRDLKTWTKGSTINHLGAGVVKIFVGSIFSIGKPPVSYLSPPVQVARWAHMHHCSVYPL